MRAWQSQRRIVCVLAGTQGGKTSFGPIWLWREICRRGPGDYLVVSPSYPLLELKALPEFKRLFGEQLQAGRYVSGTTRRFEFSRAGEIRAHGHAVPGERTIVFFGHAENPDSLESATAKAAWLDECGQKRFKLGSWEAILRRVALHTGRLLPTTTPYNLGWLKTELYDRWRAGAPDIDLVRFDSTENPAFPRAEWERARARLPRWKFDLFYRAIFTRPAGSIYESFDRARHTCPRIAIAPEWPRFLGLDFGGVNTAGMYYAEEPKTRRLFAYREYLAGGRTAAQHAMALMRGEPRLPLCVGGSKSEGQWRQEFCAAGLPVQPPAVTEVEVGIDRVIACHQKDEIIVFDDLKHYLEQKESYARELDDKGNPTEEIEDKETYHLLDAERYIIGRIRGGVAYARFL